MTSPSKAPRRYEAVHASKSAGSTYTPPRLAQFVAREVIGAAGDVRTAGRLRILDPAVGDGELLVSLIAELQKAGCRQIEAHGFDTDAWALEASRARLESDGSDAELHLARRSFLDFVLAGTDDAAPGSLFRRTPEPFDLIISNPPYVRTQIIGARQARVLAGQFGLSGRVDLYHAFLLAMGEVLNPEGVAGMIVSNRFLSTRSGASVRAGLRRQFKLRHVWDLGDTKLFGAAVLPAVLIAQGRNGASANVPRFTSVYEALDAKPDSRTEDAISALQHAGLVRLQDGRCLRVQHGTLAWGQSAEAVWRLSTAENEKWLETVRSHAWGTFGDIGRVRVGVKTCADRVFIRQDWKTICDGEPPELLRPLTTHHVARRFRPRPSRRFILYPHERSGGARRAVDLERYPRSREYLEAYRGELAARRYVLDAGRAWYEIWIPQDPAAWALPKLVFRDIANAPAFWIDDEGSVVNGDCYWLVCEKGRPNDLLWLACAVGNSSFAEAFYDHSFNNKLYAGRRRFMTQYVMKFPLPDPACPAGRELCALAREIHAKAATEDTESLERELDRLVWRAFGLPAEERVR